MSRGKFERKNKLKNDKKWAIKKKQELNMERKWNKILRGKIKRKKPKKW
jgi:hypothetical protein